MLRSAISIKVMVSIKLEIYNLNKKIDILENQNSRHDSLEEKMDKLEIENKELNSELKIKMSYIQVLELKCHGESSSEETKPNQKTESYHDKKTIEILNNRIKHLEEVNT